MNALNDTVASNNLYASRWLINICRHSRITMVLYWMIAFFFFKREKRNTDVLVEL